MRAVLYDRTGGPEVLYVAEVAEPIPAEGGATVRVRTVGLNPYDHKVRRGVARGPDFPRGTGIDFAGVVAGVGGEASYEGGDPVGVGDEVLGWSAGLALRELVPVPSAHLARKPAGLSWGAAAALTTPTLTAHAALETLGIGAADVVLLSAAAGGVGVVYGQLARLRGATVLGTASPGNHDFLRELGMIPVSYGPGLAGRVRDLAPSPVTAVQDNIGGETIEVALELGLPPDRICTLADFAAVERLGIRTPGKYARSTAQLEQYARLAEAGELRLPVAETFALDRVADAFALLETGHVRGKVVVDLSPSPDPG